VPLGLGVIFGLAQQARGAHFLSHDLVSLGICWLCAAFWCRLFYADALRLEAVNSVNTSLASRS
jgi:membrane-associated PAP2 superfamily phosphatase